MRELLILLVVVAAVAIIWYLRQERTKAAEQRRVDHSRRIAADATDAGRASETALDTPHEASAPSAEASPAAKGAGLFQDAAGSAVGLPYERAVDQMEEVTADHANARRDAERAAERLANRATEALEAIQASAVAHGGAVPGDGTDRCPPNYPVKGTTTAMQYHHPGDPSYNQTIPDVCFVTATGAEAAGFSESGDRASSRRDAAAAEHPAVDQFEVGPKPDPLRAAATEDRP